MPEEPKLENLGIEDERVGAWMTMSNWFEKDNPNRPRRTGILVQLGAFPSRRFKEALFYKGSTLIKTLARGDFHWINIEAEYASQPALEPKQAFRLWPNPGHPEDQCSELNKRVLAGDNCFQTLAGEMTKIHLGCIRNATLHWNLQVLAILTYWQGKGGYTMEAAQETDTDPNAPDPAASTHDRYRFFFDADPFTIAVYKAEEEDSGWVMVPVPLIDGQEKVTQDKVDRVVLMSEPGGPGGEKKVDPPMGGGG